MISRRPDPDNRRQVVYELTDKGIDLLPVLFEIVLWGAKHDAHTAAPKDKIKRMRADREGMLRELAASLKARRGSVPRG